jgi:hypothetical protein
MFPGALMLLSLAGAPPLSTGAMPQNAPPAIAEALRTAADALHFIDRCDRRPAEGYDPRHERYDAAVEDAVGRWGREVEPGASTGDAWTGKKCDRAIEVAARTAVNMALARETVLFAEATREMAKGLWIGSWHLCRSLVVSAGVSLDHDLNAARLNLELVPAARPILARVSADTLDRRLSVMLDGAVISRPAMNSEIADGEFYLVGPEKETLQRLAAAAMAPC